MVSIDVFVKGDMQTPARFWDYALRTVTKYSKYYDELGYVFSEIYTKQYRELSDEDKKKVNFKYIDGVLQV